MGETLGAPPGPEEQPGEPSFLDRAVGVFISPATAFESIVRRPNFLAPLIIAMAAGIVVTETMLQKIGIERIVRRSIEISGKAAQMNPDQMQQAIHQGSSVGSILAHVGGVVGPPIYLLVVAGVGLLIVNTIFGASTNFKTSFSVVCYAYLVSLVGAVLAVVVIFFGDPEQFNPQNFVPSSVGFFLNPLDTPKALYTIASSYDIFTIWFLFLASLGLSIASAKKVRTISILLVFIGLWTIWVFGKVGVGMLTG